ncbi:polysaccharide pyruvyl transferase family protein [Bacillus nitratireducens]|uniref:polysaccharide pyruvyl transferase family protein n=1 Tax=Bacillus nitratireducens TaxID=2026193 RepID=UPI001F5A47EF|nr:polysaccharide pyruvyl transferase family protein [Bacillus nitratireducens]UNP74895.1 polysaccharide pyruvyl transferase family protein [Bacillus nitratireducens]
MKICTITCHDVYNHGASLQAYGLMKYLTNCAHEVEIIDYKPNYLDNHYNLLSIDSPKWRKNIITKAMYLALRVPTKIPGLKRKKAFDKFTRKYLKITKGRYASNDELKNNIPYADAYICGSDQIWNTLHRNGKDPAFYLDFVPAEKIKASYAASFAVDIILDEDRSMIKERVGKLDSVSVREKSGVEILNKLQIEKVVNVVDPVFLLDKFEWNNMITREFEENYILIYDFDNSHIIKKMAIEIAKERGYRIYTINPGKYKYADKCFNYDGPEIFVSLVKNAKVVISNSFHAAVFSIIYERDFIIVNRKEAINARMRDLLDDLGFKERLVTESYNLEKLLNQIDYREAKIILDEKIKESKIFLRNVLSIKK